MSVFNDDFETGTILTSENPAGKWPDKYEGSGCTVSIEGNIKHNGNYSAKCSTVADSGASCYTTFTAQNNAYLRGYYRLSAMPPNNDDFIYFNELYNSTYGSAYSAGAAIRKLDGQLYWGLVALENNNPNWFYESTPSNPSAGTWYCVEVRRDIATGTVQLWVDGSLKISQSISISQTNNGIFPGTSVSYGFATSLYIDDLVLSNTYIGPQSTSDLTVSGNLTVGGNAIVDGTLTVGSTLFSEGGGVFNGFAVGFGQYGSLPYPYETIQLNSNWNLRFAFGTTERAILTNGGQLQLTNPGSSGGIMFGDDTTLYRSAENTLRTNDRFNIVCPVSAVIPEYIKNQGWLWHYTSGIWDPSGMPIETTTNYLALQHPTLLDPNNNNQPYYADWTLAMIATGRQDYPYWPTLYTHSGMMIQRDLSVGGFVASNQGALALGHGLLKQMDPPKIWLVDSATSYIDGIVYQPDAPENPKDAQLFICNTDQNPYYELFHLYEWSGGQWRDQGDISAFQNQYFDTLHISKSDGKTPGHLDLGNLTAHGDVWTAAIHSVNGTYVQIADTLYTAGGIFPNSFDNQDCGSASFHWDYVRGNHLCYDIDHYLFDALDDLAIVKNYKTKTMERKLKSGETVSIDVIDRESMSHLLDEDGLYAQEKVGGFLLGCIKALVLRLEALEKELATLD